MNLASQTSSVKAVIPNSEAHGFSAPSPNNDPWSGLWSYHPRSSLMTYFMLSQPLCYRNKLVKGNNLRPGFRNSKKENGLGKGLRVSRCCRSWWSDFRVRGPEPRVEGGSWSLRGLLDLKLPTLSLSHTMQINNRKWFQKDFKPVTAIASCSMTSSRNQSWRRTRKFQACSTQAYQKSPHWQ